MITDKKEANNEPKESEPEEKKDEPSEMEEVFMLICSMFSLCIGCGPFVLASLFTRAFVVVDRFSSTYLLSSGYIID